MIDFVRYRKWFYLVTAILMIVTAVALAAPPRIPWGLEFTSGSALEFQFVNKPENVTAQDVQQKLQELGLEGSIVQAVGEKGFFIRTSRVEDELEPVLTTAFGDVTIVSLEGVGNFATIVSFTDPVPESAIRGALTGLSAEAKATKLGEARYFVTAPGRTEAEIKQALAAVQQRYGPADIVSYEGADNMALVLDFGPLVPASDFEAKLKEIYAGFQSVPVGENSYLVTGTDVPQDARSGLVTALEAPFGKAKTTPFDRPEDMAMVLTFVERPTIEDVRTELLSQQAFSVVSVAQRDKQVLLFGRDYPTDQQDKLFTAMKTKFGEVERQPFSFGAGMAVVLDFGRTVNDTILNQRLSQLSPFAIGIGLGNNRFFAGGRGIPQDQRDAIIVGLETGFGIAQQAPVDPSQLVPLEVRFTDPVQLTDVQAHLAVIPVTDAIGTRAKIQSADTGSFVLVGTGLSAEQRAAVLTDLEQAVGKVESAGFAGPDDMHLALDFGPATTAVDVRSIVNSVEPSLLLESIASNKFLIIGAAVPADKKAAVLAALEQRFGQAKQQTYAGSEDILWALKFKTTTTNIGAVRSAISTAGVTGATVAQASDGSFFVVASGLPADRQASLQASLKQSLGNFTQTTLDPVNGMVIGLDFGEAPDLATLRAAVHELGPETIYVESAGAAGFFLGGKGIPLARQDELVGKLQDQFGLAKRAAFPGPEDLATIVTLTDQERLAQILKQTVVVHKLAPNSFFLGQANITPARREQVLSSLQTGLGAMRQQPFDFNLGMAAAITFPRAVTPEEIKATLEPVGYTNLVIEPKTANTYFIRSDRPEAGQRNQIIQALEAAFGPISRENIEFSFVDPEIARRSILNTVFAVGLSSIGILLYVWYAFRKAPKPFRYGVATLIALLHDVVLVVGAFALMAKFRQVEIDSLMVIGVLAVIGFSVNNTIVVIDRVRENLGRFPNRPFEETVNISLNETLSRNINTTVTTCLAILAVLFFGGPTIFNFMLVLFIGILAGLYSSLFLATPMLVSWERGEMGFRKKRAPSVTNTVPQSQQP